MQVSTISLDHTNRFNRLILDYVNSDEKLRDFYTLQHTVENYAVQIEERKKFPVDRQLLANALLKQYEAIGGAQEKVLGNIESLRDEQTFTVTTGHQLNIFTGPLYFIYKILHTIKLAEELGKAYPFNSFVPIYWMNSEDHDIAEVGQFNLFGKKYVWETEQIGATGKMNPESLDSFCDQLQEVFSSNDATLEMIALFRKAYTQFENLADSTRFFCNELFRSHGLVIIDSDDRSLKYSFIDFFKEDIIENRPYHLVRNANQKIAHEYHVQVNPREINCFYLSDGLRNRIVRTETGFHVLRTDIRFTTEQLLNELEIHPERFSPNVVLRPLFQEFILPNLTYVGGGGELAYWLQYKDYFGKMGVSFPMLSLRNHFLLIDTGMDKRLQELNLFPQDLFHSIEELIKEHVLELADTEVSIGDEKKLLSELYSNLKRKAEEIDGSLVASIEAEQTRLEKGLEQWSGRFTRSLKQQNEVSVNRIRKIHNSLFPNGYLQERHDNFMAFYAQNPTSFFADVYTATKPFDTAFRIMTF